MPVKVPKEVLCCRSLIGPSRIYIDNQNPDFFAIVIKGKEIRTFPNPSVSSGIATEITFSFPFFQIRRGIERYPVFCGKGHDPFFTRLIPHYFWVSKIRYTG